MSRNVPRRTKNAAGYCFEKGILRFVANTVESQKEMRDVT